MKGTMSFKRFGHTTRVRLVLCCHFQPVVVFLFGLYFGNKPTSTLGFDPQSDKAIFVAVLKTASLLESASSSTLLSMALVRRVFHGGVTRSSDGRAGGTPTAAGGRAGSVSTERNRASTSFFPLPAREGCEDSMITHVTIKCPFLYVILR